MPSKNNMPSIAEKTARLNAMAAWFDSEDFDLEQAIEKFNDAQKLAEEIERDLLSLKNEITILSQKFDEVE